MAAESGNGGSLYERQMKMAQETMVRSTGQDALGKLHGAIAFGEGLRRLSFNPQDR